MMPKMFRFLVLFLISSSLNGCLSKRHRYGHYSCNRGRADNHPPGSIPVKTKECSCGVKYEVRGRIIGGVEAAESEFPWQVAMYNGATVSCGGSLINDRYVLTAGHCFKIGDKAKNTVINFPQENITYILGGTFLEDIHKMRSSSADVIERVPQSTLIHPQYNPFTFKCDIALSKLKEPVLEYNYKVLPVCLPPVGPSYTNYDATVSGWGVTTESGGVVKSLMKTDIKILPTELCEKKLKQHYDKPSMMCGASPGHDACQGDSGGPLVVKHGPYTYVQIGVVSSGIGCGNYRYPGMYTRVNRFLPWIKKNTRDGVYCEGSFMTSTS